MHRTLVTLLPAILIALAPHVGGFSPAAAQPAAAQPAAPIVLLADNDLWLWSEGGRALVPLTQDAHVLGVALSPDGRYLAYMAHAPLTIDALARTGGIGGGMLPSDIWVVDLASLQFTPVAVQPPDASFFTDGVEDNALLRSIPTWSPDGTEIGWAEVHYPSFSRESDRLMAYNVTTGATRQIVSGLPEAAGVPGPAQVLWGGGGLAVLNYAYDQATNLFYNEILVYSIDGTRRAQTRVGDDISSPVVDYLWIEQAGQAYVGMYYADGSWKLVHPQTGSLETPPGAPQLVSALVPAESLALALSFDASVESYWDSFNWTLIKPNGQPGGMLDMHRAPYQVTLSPDGQAIAYIAADGSLVVWRDGQIASQIAAPDPYGTILWGPTVWRIGGGSAAPITVPTQTITCPGAPPSRLAVGGQGRVLLTTTPNNLRDQPATGTILGQIPPGGAFTVLAGPQCAAGLAWWQVDHNGTVGWTAEGDSGGYWLEPLN
ncbi:MAG: SH3 domain-containing protein [Anaerolineae bacterium]|nr:SH3 domain-containing protein [Anaerolineae bacterium]